MPWPFCPHCGSILSLPEIGNIACGNCKSFFDFSSFGSIEVTTYSMPRPLPRWVEELESQVTQTKRRRATVDEECPKCGHMEMEFYTMQLRSVDEGQTVFYDCLNPTCKSMYLGQE